MNFYKAFLELLQSFIKLLQTFLQSFYKAFYKTFEIKLFQIYSPPFQNLFLVKI